MIEIYLFEIDIDILKVYFFPSLPTPSRREVVGCVLLWPYDGSWFYGTQGRGTAMEYEIPAVPYVFEILMV